MALNALQQKEPRARNPGLSRVDHDTDRDTDREPLTQRSSSQGEWWPIKEIIAEKPCSYQVTWDGTDLQTGLPWNPDWIPKSAVTEDAKAEWDENKRAKREAQRKKRKHATRPAHSVIVAIPNDQSTRSSQTSEYQPSQLIPRLDSYLPALRTRIPTEIEDSFEVSRSFATPSPLNPASAHCKVVISRPHGFDAAQYLNYSEGHLTADTRNIAEDTAPNAYDAPTAADLDSTTQLVRSVPLNDSRVVPDSQGFDDTSILTLESSTSLLEESSPVEADRSSSDEDLQYEDASEFIESTQAQAIEAIDLFESPPPSYEESISQSTDRTRGQVTTTSESESQLLLVGTSQDSKVEELQTNLGLPEKESASLKTVLEELWSSFDRQIEAQGQEEVLIPASNPKEISSSQENSASGDQSIFSSDSQPERQPETQISNTTFISTTTLEDHSDSEVQRVPQLVSKETPHLQGPTLSRQEEGTVASSVGEKLPITKQFTSLEDISRINRSRVTSEEPVRRSHLSDWFNIDRRRQRFESEPVQSQASPTLVPRSPDSEFTTPSSTNLMSESSEFQMPSAPPSGAQSLRERLAARKKLLDERTQNWFSTRSASSDRGSRSPSVLPQRGVSPAPLTPAVPETAISPKSNNSSTPTILPIASALGSENVSLSQASVIHPSSSQTHFGAPKLGIAEYVVGLPLRTETVSVGALTQKTAYIDTLVRNHVDIERYLADPSSADAALGKSIENTITSAARIATHPSLPSSASLSLDIPEEKQAEYDVFMSEKFRFLKAIFTAVRESLVKIAIVAEPGKLIDMLEIFMRGIMVQHTRLDKISTLPPMNEDSFQGIAKAYIVPSSGSGAVANQCHAVIAMDSTFDANSYEIKQIRSNMFNPAKIAPVLRLVALNTVEHALLCLSKDINEQERLRAIIEAATVLRNDAGVQDRQYPPSETLNDMIASWIVKKCEGELNIPTLPDMPLFEAATQTQPEIHIDTRPKSPEGNGEKRKREDSLAQETSVSSEASSAKRARFTEEPIIEEYDKDDVSMRDVSTQDTIVRITPLADVVERAVSEPVLSVEPMTIAETSFAIDGVSEGDTEVVFVQPSTVPGEKKLIESTKEELVSMIQTRNNDFNVWVESTARLQTRYEELKKTLRELTAKLQQHQRAEALATSRRDRTLQDVARLGAQNTELGAELDAAVERLRRGPPEKAEMERMIAENAELRAKLEAAYSKVRSTEREAEFAREQYQKASNATFEMRREMEELQRKTEDLERRADERTIKLRQLQLENAFDQRDKQLEELTIRLKERDERIAKLEQEKANPRARGAWGTRSVSVPRRGSPAQSRASSPALAALTLSPGSTGHPLRNASG